jgi:hypothetical protein
LNRSHIGREWSKPPQPGGFFIGASAAGDCFRKSFGAAASGAIDFSFVSTRNSAVGRVELRSPTRIRAQ